MLPHIKYILILIPLDVVRVMVKYWAEIVAHFNKQVQIINHSLVTPSPTLPNTQN